ncbi:UreE family protein [Streptomyces erythrochromogenes]|uniref:hypothetical protein n=1 Tax=Streptomyces erythrochromogenes TaxID=285574 RepID=UPI0036B0AF8D
MEDLETDDGYAFELARPLFLAADDRIAFEDGRLVVVRAGGERLTPAGDWCTRCGPGARRRSRTPSVEATSR